MGGSHTSNDANVNMLCSCNLVSCNVRVGASVPSPQCLMLQFSSDSVIQDAKLICLVKNNPFCSQQKVNKRHILGLLPFILK
jgi:hypothetical protein